MTKQEFFEKISDVLQLDETATSATELTDDIWDSASQMATMVFFGKEFPYSSLWTTSYTPIQSATCSNW